MRVKNKVKGQGATEYLLMLAAVLVIVAVAIYYVTRAGGYPVIGAYPELSGENEIILSSITGEIATGEWAYSVSATERTYDWKTGNEALKAPSVSLGTYAAGTWYVSLKHIDSAHIYFADEPITIS